MPHILPSHFCVGWEIARLASGSHEKVTLDRTVWIEVLDHETRFHGSNGDNLYLRCTVPSTLLPGETPWRAVVPDTENHFARISTMAGKPKTGGLNINPETVTITELPSGRIRIAYDAGTIDTRTSVEAGTRDVEWPQQFVNLYERHVDTESDMVARSRPWSYHLLAKVEKAMGGAAVVLVHGTTSARFSVEHANYVDVSAVGVISTKSEG